MENRRQVVQGKVHQTFGRVLDGRSKPTESQQLCPGRGRELGVVIPLATGARGELRWALDLLESEVWVVGVLEPVEAPLASWLESGRE